MRSCFRPLRCGLDMPRAGSLIAALSSKKAGCPSRVMALFEVADVAPHHGIRRRSSPMYGSGCADCSASHWPARDRPTSVPSGLRFLPPGRREFRSGIGLLCPCECGLVLPQRQHQHGKFSRGRNGCPGKTASCRHAGSPTLQRREYLHARDQGRRRLEQQAPRDAIATFRNTPGPIDFSRLMPSRHEAQEGSDIPSSPKARRVINQGNKIQCDDGADVSTQRNLLRLYR